MHAYLLVSAIAVCQVYGSSLSCELLENASRKPLRPIGKASAPLVGVERAPSGKCMSSGRHVHLQWKLGMAFCMVWNLLCYYQRIVGPQIVTAITPGDSSEARTQH
jgi:hypothetical protein